MTFDEAMQVILSSEVDNPLRSLLELAVQGTSVRCPSRDIIEVVAD